MLLILGLDQLCPTHSPRDSMQPSQSFVWPSFCFRWSRSIL